MRGIINGKIILENAILENHILLFDKNMNIYAFFIYMFYIIRFS